jgi:hypothetical protein
MKLDKQKLLEWLTEKRDKRRGQFNLEENVWNEVIDRIMFDRFDVPDRRDVETIQQHDEMLHNVFGQLQEANYGRVIGD